MKNIDKLTLTHLGSENYIVHATKIPNFPTLHRKKCVLMVCNGFELFRFLNLLKQTMWVLVRIPWDDHPESMFLNANKNNNKIYFNTSFLKQWKTAYSAWVRYQKDARPQFPLPSQNVCKATYLDISSSFCPLVLCFSIPLSIDVQCQDKYLLANKKY